MGQPRLDLKRGRETVAIRRVLDFRRKSGAFIYKRIAGLANNNGSKRRAVRSGRGHKGTAQAVDISQAPTPSRLQSDVSRIARALEEANRHPGAAAEIQRAKENLKAQQDTAKWAAWMLLVGSVEAGITFIGVVLVGFTLAATRKAAGAARDTVTAMDTTAKRELRAYNQLWSRLALQHWMIGIQRLGT